MRMTTRHALMLIAAELRRERQHGHLRRRCASRDLAYRRAAVLIVAAEHAPDPRFLERRAAELMAGAHKRKP